MGDLIYYKPMPYGPDHVVNPNVLRHLPQAEASRHPAPRLRGRGRVCRVRDARRVASPNEPGADAVKSFAVLVLCVGLILALSLVDRSPAVGLSVYVALAALTVGMCALSDRRAS